MKKKILEKIQLREAAEGYDAAAWTFEENLVIDIREEGIRIVVGKKEFANFREDTRIWCEGSIENMSIKENMTMLPAEEQMVIGWVKEREKIWRRMGSWQDAVEEMEKRIRQNKRWRAEELKSQRLKERCNSMPAIPNDFPAWTESCFGQSMLFYHRTNKRHVKVFCTKCGGTAEYAFRRIMTPEGMFERTWEEPSRGQVGTCMLCGAKGVYKSDRKQGVYGKSGIAYVIQKYREGIVIRQFICERYSEPDMRDRFVQIEQARAFYLGEKVILDYKYTNNWTLQTQWHDCNMPGMANITWKEGTIWPGSFEELKGTRYQYSGLREYYDWHNQINPRRYIETYQKAPALEYLVKVRMNKLVEHILQFGTGIINPSGRSPQEVLKLPAAETRRFLKENGDSRQLDLMQQEARNGWKIDRQTEKELLQSGMEVYRIGIALRFMGARKLMNQLMKYAGARNPWSSMARERMKNVSVTYTDYLMMREGMGYDMTNGIILFPRNLQEAHHDMVIRQNEQKASKELAEKEARYGAEIRKRFQDAARKYAWENGEREIRPAESAGEIVQEGWDLHHCVGGNNYLERHASGKSTILFLRKKEKAEVPYITVEVIGNRINQWFGAYDQKTDREENEEWLKEYQQVLRKRAV